MPCGHLCLCDGCRRAYEPGSIYPRQLRLCPLCKGEVGSTLKVYGSDSTKL